MCGKIHHTGTRSLHAVCSRDRWCDHVVVTAEDLLLSKLAWAAESRSEIQLQDVRNLIRSVADLDWTYIERWATELTLGELLREVRG